MSTLSTLTANPALNFIDISAIEAVKAEGSSPSSFTTYTFKVTRTDKTTSSSVNYSVKHISTDAFDFSGPLAGTVVFAAGEDTKEISITVNADTAAEGNEQFKVILSTPFGASLRTASATATISDDDTPVLSIVARSASKAEGQTNQNGPTGFTFTVTRNTKAGTSTVNWSIEHISTSSSDFESSTSGQIKFSPGETSKIITAYAKTDLVTEKSEDFNIKLTSPINATLKNATATGTIVNDDFPTLSIVALEANKAEGTNSNGTGNTFRFRVNRTASAGSASVNYSVVNVDTTSADFLAPSGGTVNFADGELFKDIEIKIAGDDLVESSEKFRVQLSTATQAIINPDKSFAVGTIQNDDSANFKITARDSAKKEGTEKGTTPFTFLVTRNTDTGTASVNWAIEHLSSSGTTASDFSGPQSGTVKFLGGETSKSITVYVNQDSSIEKSENFRVSLSQPVGGKITTPSALSTIINDDFPTLSIAALNPVQLEKSPGNSTDYNFRISRTNGLGTSTVSYFVKHIKTSEADFISATTGTVFFGEAEQYKDITIKVQGDNLPEDKEIFQVELSNPMQAILNEKASTALAYIVNDDLPSLSISSLKSSVAEGQAGKTPLTFKIDRDSVFGSSAVAWEVDLSASDSASLNDFLGPTQGTVKFAEGENSKIITLYVVGDEQIEKTESISVKLLNPTEAKIAISAAKGSIINDDYPTVGITAVNAQVLEGNTNPGAITFRLTRSSSLVESSVNFLLTNITTKSEDFSGPLAGAVNFAAGELTKDVSILLANDKLAELNESFKISLINPTNIKIKPETSTATGIILDDDVPVISIVPLNASKNEGQSGLTPFTFNVLRDSGIGESVVNWQIDSNLPQGASLNDFSGPTNGTISFKNGQTSQKLTVYVKADTDFELSEIFSISITPQKNAYIGTGQASGVILNDDKPTVSIRTLTPSSLEGSDPTQVDRSTVQFEVFRNASDETASVVYELSHITTKPEDFLNSTAGLVHFEAGETSKIITITVNPDLIPEKNESFQINLKNPTNTKIGTASAVATISDDDFINTLTSVSRNSLYEGSSTTQTLDITFTRDNFHGESSVSWEVKNGTTNNSDFTGPTSGTILFADGQTSKTITLSIKPDSDVESNEEFTIITKNLSHSNILTDPIPITIINDDATIEIPGIYTPIPSQDRVEGTGGGSISLSYQVELEGSSTLTPINWHIVHGTTDDSDFTGPTSGVLTSASTKTSQYITVNVVSDDLYESNENFSIVLTSPDGQTVGQRLSGLIEDDDPPVVRIWSSSVIEGSSGNGTSALSFTLTRNSNIGSSTVDWTILNTKSDFVATSYHASAADISGPTSGSVTFADGEFSKTIQVLVQQDLDIERNELVNVQILNPINARIDSQRNSSAGTILNDDYTDISIKSVDADKNEDNFGSTAFQFSFERNNSFGSAYIDWEVQNITTDANDFDIRTNGRSYIYEGESLKNLTIYTSTDSKAEKDETFKLVIKEVGINPGSMNHGEKFRIDASKSEAIGTIRNDDTPLITFDSPSVVKKEGDAGQTEFQFIVVRDSLIGESSVNWEVVHAGTKGTNTQDFAMSNSPMQGVLNFAEGQGSQTITLQIEADTINEFSEAFYVNLSSPINAVIGQATSTGIVLNDDQPTLSISALQTTPVEEGSGVPGTLTFEVKRSTRDGYSAVNYTLGATTGTATASASDFTTPVAGTLEFLDGEDTKIISLSTAPDITVEYDEKVVITLFAPENSVLSSTNFSAESIIKNDDTPRLSIVSYDANKAEGSSLGTDKNIFQFKVIRDTKINSSSVDWAVNFSQSNSATSDDFSGLMAGTINFSDGESEKLISLDINKDKTIEDTETIYINLSNPSNGILATATATGTIINDDYPEFSIVSVSPTEQDEKDSGILTYEYKVSRTSGSGLSSISFGVTHVSTDLDDFSGTTVGILNFQDQETEKIIQLQVKSDTTIERDESFIVFLHSAEGAVIDPQKNKIASVIKNDDLAIVNISAKQAIFNEGTPGIGNQIANEFIFAVTRSSNLGSSSVDWTLEPDLQGNITSTDFNSPTSGTISFLEGETQKNISLTIQPDSEVETNEQFVIKIKSPVNAKIGAETASGLIINDDQPFLEISSGNNAAPLNLTESDGTSGFVFNVTRSSVHGTASVNYQVVHQTTTASDFDGALAGTVEFSEGENSRQIIVNTIDDSLVESDESFKIILMDAIGVSIKTSQANGIIKNDDGILFKITPYNNRSNEALAEGDTEKTPFRFIIERNTAIGSNVVNWSLDASQATGFVATADDFSGPTSGTVVFQEGETQKKITLYALADTIPEESENFAIALTKSNQDISQAVLSGSLTAYGTILNDDIPAFSIKATDAEKTEDTPGSTTLTEYLFTVSRNAATSSASVNYSVANSGTSAADFSGPTAGSLYFDIGEKEKTIKIYAAQDDTTEATESFRVVLNSPLGASIQTSSASGKIIDNDLSTTNILSLKAFRTEGTSGKRGILIFSVMRDSSIGESSVQWSVNTPNTLGMASSSDFGTKKLNGTMKFLDGQKLRNIYLSINNDSETELTENFEVSISDAQNTKIGMATAVGTIFNDDFLASSATTATAALQTAPTEQFFYFRKPEDINAVAPIDFHSGTDRIEIVSANFGMLPVGVLSADRLFIDTQQIQTDTRAAFIYDSQTGQLSFDSNGSAAGGLSQITKLSPDHKSLTANDIYVVPS